MLDRLVFASPRWAFLGVMGALALVKTGLWLFPNTAMIVQIAADPLADPFPPDYRGHYQMWTWLSPAIAGTLRTTSVLSFWLLHLGCALAFVALVVWAMYARLPERSARVATIVFALLPVSWIAFYGVGPDGLTLLLLAVALVGARRWWLVLLCGFLLGTQHAEQAALAAVAVAISDLLGRRFSGQAKEDATTPLGWRWGAVVLVGAIAGRLALTAVFSASGVGTPSGRAEWISDFGGVLVERAYFGWPWLLWSVLGLGWLVAAFHLTLGREAVAVFVPLALLAVLTPLVFDQTRVMAIVTFPLLYRVWLSDERFLSLLGSRRAVGLGVAWVVVPVIFVLGAEPFGPVLPYSLALVSNWAFGFPTVPADPLELGIWPFS